MSIRKKFLYVFVFFTLDMFLIIGFLIIRDATSYNLLSKEVAALSDLDVATDRYNRRVQSNGGYAVVEQAMKDYLDEYALEIQELSQFLSTTQLKSILSFYNYQEDGPEFVNSLAYLDEIQEDFNSRVDDLIQKASSKSVESYILGKTTDEYFISLYNQYMFEENLIHSLTQSKTILKSTRVDINHMIDVSREVLQFLNTYNGSWELEDNTIKFKTQDLCNYYDSLIQEVMINKKETK